MAIETALAIYNSSHRVEVKMKEAGFVVEVTMGHITDHVMTEMRKHIKFMTGQEIESWDLLPQSGEKMKLVFTVSNRRGDAHPRQPL